MFKKRINSAVGPKQLAVLLLGQKLETIEQKNPMYDQRRDKE
jgi:hypothetical protein